MSLIAIPLLLIPFALYNMIAFLLNLTFSEALFGVSLISGARLSVTAGDVLMVIGVLLLYVEIVKATRLGSKAIVDHVLSLILLIGMALEFLTVERAATGTFLVLTALSFVDVIGGFSITIRTSQRDVAFEHVDDSGV